MFSSTIEQQNPIYFEQIDQNLAKIPKYLKHAVLERIFADSSALTKVHLSRLIVHFDRLAKANFQRNLFDEYMKFATDNEWPIIAREVLRNTKSHDSAVHIKYIKQKLAYYHKLIQKEADHIDANYEAWRDDKGGIWSTEQIEVWSEIKSAQRTKCMGYINEQTQSWQATLKRRVKILEQDKIIDKAITEINKNISSEAKREFQLLKDNLESSSRKYVEAKTMAARGPLNLPLPILNRFDIEIPIMSTLDKNVIKQLEDDFKQICTEAKEKMHNKIYEKVGIELNFLAGIQTSILAKLKELAPDMTPLFQSFSNGYLTRTTFFTENKIQILKDVRESKTEEEEVLDVSTILDRFAPPNLF
ncbi:unnamed protein product [Didymodactylos carnosus]|nr:unnamed protein product [Didymodactylos carnosus]